MNIFQQWKRNIGVLVGLLVISLWFSCNNPSLVGSDLVDQDGIEVLFTDTTTVNALIILGTDSVLINGNNTLSTDLFVGKVNDPFFGTDQYESFIQASLGSSAPSFYDFDNNAFATIDSIVLIMNVDTSLYYGDMSALHNIDVFLLQDELEQDIELYTKDDLPTEMTAISEVQSSRPSFENFELAFGGDTSVTSTALRIKLDNSFGQMIINDSSAVKSDTLFKKLVKGFKISSDPTSSSLIPLDATSQTLDNIGNKMLLFYTDTIAKVYSFPLGGVRHTYVQKDIAGTALESALNNDVFSDSLILIQGFGGANARITFPNANFANYGNILVKKAELEVTVADQMGDDENLDPLPLIFLYENNFDEEDRIFVTDLQIASNIGSITGGFGGNLREELDDNGEVIRRFYNFNLTSYFQQLIDQDSDQVNSLYMEAAIQKVSPGRSIFFGAGNTTNPMKLKLTYSIPN